MTTKAWIQSTKMKVYQLSNSKSVQSWIYRNVQAYRQQNQILARRQRREGRPCGGKNVITDMVDMICSSEYLMTNLIFRNTSRARNTAIDSDVVKQLKERLGSRGENFPFHVTQTKNKFKKCVAECKKAALTIKTATGIKHHNRSG